MSNGRHQANRGGASQHHLRAHRLFPVAVAVWTAALFGLSSLAVSAQVFEAIVVKLGLPDILPAAAPPLGLTARLLLALMLAFAGGVTGLVAGRIVGRRGSASAVDAGDSERPVDDYASDYNAARPSAPASEVRLRRRDAHPDAPPRRPLVLTEDLLPLTSDSFSASRNADPVFSAANVIIQQEEPVAVQDDYGDEAFAAQRFVADQPLAELQETVAPFGQPAEPATDVSDDESVSVDWAAEDEQAAPVQEPVAAQAFETASETVIIASKPFEQPQAVLDASPLPPILPHVIASYSAPTIPDALVAGAPRSPLANAPINTLGLVQLIERLALALAERSALREAAAIAPRAAVQDQDGYRAKPSASEARAPFQTFGSFEPEADPTPPGLLLRTKPGRGAAPYGWSDEGLDANAFGATTQQGSADPFAGDTSDTRAFAAPYSDDDAAVADDDRYPSLLGMSLLTSSRHVGRTDEPAPFLSAAPKPPFDVCPVDHATPDWDAVETPVVPFAPPSAAENSPWPVCLPNRKPASAMLASPPDGTRAATHDAEAADRALRDALETLKRMTAKG